MTHEVSPAMREAALAEARKLNPGRTDDHIKSVALDALSIYRAMCVAEEAESGLEWRKLLVVSTSHVSAATAEYLNNTPCEDWSFSGGPYGDAGWFAYCHETNGLMSDPARNIPDDLFEVMTFARAHGADNVLLDRDSDAVDGLATYDWQSSNKDIPDEV